MKATIVVEKEVRAVLDRFVEAHKQRNLDELMSLFGQDEDVTVLGTDLDDKRIGKEAIQYQLERDFAPTSTYSSMEITECMVSSAENVAWLIADCKHHYEVEGKNITKDRRLTVVLEKRADNWLIMQWHKSAPADGE